MKAAAEKKTTRKMKARGTPKVTLASDIPEVSAAPPSKPPDMGAVVEVGKTDLAVLNALNEAMVKAKALAFDQFMAVLGNAGQILEPINTEFRDRVQEAAKTAGCKFSDDVEWTFVLEDGSFKRTK